MDAWWNAATEAGLATKAGLLDSVLILLRDNIICDKSKRKSLVHFSYFITPNLFLIPPCLTLIPYLGLLLRCQHIELCTAISAVPDYRQIQMMYSFLDCCHPLPISFHLRHQHQVSRLDLCLLVAKYQVMSHFHCTINASVHMNHVY